MIAALGSPIRKAILWMFLIITAAALTGIAVCKRGIRSTPCQGKQFSCLNKEIQMWKAAVLVLASACALSGCATQGAGPVDTRNSALTQGNVQLNLRVGETTKAQVLEVFGSPNITTRDASGAETWSYQRHATVSQSSFSNNYWTILLLGGGQSAAGFSQSTRTMTLIIKFDSQDVVSDFRSRTSDF
jgi:outer membrane protein assembly factor BamE (lipoprotein component of BamABCDE complex)